MKIKIDGNSEGRIFEGIGAVFSNGMTKLLEDYPDGQRQDILRFLFEENFGASLQHLKVEIGSDVNTSSGTVPSHMRSKEDFDITRGSELWIAALARKINPGMTTEALRWGTPAWIQNDRDKYLYYLNFLKGAEERFGIRFDYLGCDQNEGSFDRDWVVNTLRPGLVKDGYASVKLVAAESDSGWEIAEDVLSDKELEKSVEVLNCHYTDESTQAAVETGKPLWAGEHLAAVRHDFDKGPLATAYHMLAMYPLGKMTMYEMHPALEANYGSTPFQYKGIIVATWPWSGHYEVTAGLWATAHFTQFMKPGWQYLDSGCHAGQEKKGEIPFGYISLKAPDGINWSSVFVNCSDEEKQCDLQIEGGLKADRVYVWITDEQKCFEKTEDIIVKNNKLRISVPPRSICSITTTTGQKKGAAGNEIPEQKTFLLPWEDDFNGYRTGAQPVYTSDQGGAFEIAKTRDSAEGSSTDRQKVLKQKITEDKRPIDWVYRTTPYPCTLLGSELWTDYRVEADVLLSNGESFGYIGGRSVYTGKFARYPTCYFLSLHGDGGWKLRRENEILSSGKLRQFNKDIWHRLAISFDKDKISAYLDGSLLSEVQDSCLASGQAVFGSSYHEVCFDNLGIYSDGNDFCDRYSVKDHRISLTGNWQDRDGDYGNYCRTLRSASDKDCSMAFDFDGTGVCIIGNRDRIGGEADIFLDGKLIEKIDSYAETEDDRKTKLSIPRTRNALVALYDLKPGRHTVQMKVKGTANPLSEGCKISVEAVEITGGEGLLAKKEAESCAD